MHFHILDASSITPTTCRLYFQYMSIPYFSYMFQSISHHFQGEHMYSLLKTISFYKLYVGCVIKCKKIQLCQFTILLQ